MTHKFIVYKYLYYQNLQSDKIIYERCNYLKQKGNNIPDWVFNCRIRFLLFQKEIEEKEEITGTTLRNFIKTIKLFC